MILTYVVTRKAGGEFYGIRLMVRREGDEQPSGFGQMVLTQDEYEEWKTTTPTIATYKEIP